MGTPPMSKLPSDKPPRLQRFKQALARALSVLRHGADHLQALEDRSRAAEVALMALQQRTLAVEAEAASLKARALSAEAAAQALQARSSSAESALEALSQTLHQHLPAHASHLQGLQAHAAAMQSHVQAVDKEIGTLRQRLGLHRPQLTQEQRERFYWALEAEFRGDAADVQRRQSVYRHWLEEAPAGPVLDLGCGRGEWLELLHAWGLQGQGVDASALNVAQGRSRGLQMHEADALVWLAEQADASASAITAFHLAEHLAFDDLHLLVLHAQRVLQPGGMLILESPNPENLGVATETFWLDPTHRRPLPPALLAALARACGLEVVTVLRLNPPEEDPGPVESERLLQALVQGRDCALVARKPGATRE
jgi:SAM-dependent methyltransferase